MFKDREEEEHSKNEDKSFFLRFSLFRKFSFRLESEVEIANCNYQQKFSYKDLITQMILRFKKSSELSLLEKIMSTPESADFIAFVWNDCDFWRDSAALMTVIKIQIYAHVC